MSGAYGFVESYGVSTTLSTRRYLAKLLGMKTLPFN